MRKTCCVPSESMALLIFGGKSCGLPRLREVFRGHIGDNGPGQVSFEARFLDSFTSRVCPSPCLGTIEQRGRCDVDDCGAG